MDLRGGKLDVQIVSEAPADCYTLPDDVGTAVVVPGFAILALYCLLAETLQSFRQKPAKSPAASGPCTYHYSSLRSRFVKKLTDVVKEC